MKNLTLIVLASVLIFSGCKKDDAKTCDLNSANFAGTYKITSELVNGVEIHNSANTDPCELDDLLIFNANGTYEYSDAGTVCSPSGDDSGTWSLSGSNLILDGSTEGAITDFSCTGFKVNLQDVGDVFITTFQKQ
jgi:hypothetical protein